MRSSLWVVLFLPLLGCALADECDFEQWEEDVDADECCRISDSDDYIPDRMESQFEKCHEKYPNELSLADHHHETDSHYCIEECVFSEEGLLTSQKMLSSEGVTRYFSSPSQELGPVVTAAVQRCLSNDSTHSDTANSLGCRGGAEWFLDCLDREVFVNCPKPMWSPTAICEKLKAKATKCEIDLEF